MPDDYTVEQVTTAEEWSNDYGRFQPYDLKLAGREGTVQLNRKLKDGQVPEDKVPKPGQQLYLSINGDRAKEERRDQQTNGEAPVSAPRQEKDDYARRPDHPENVARMRHAAALAAAPAYYELLRTEDVLPKADSQDKAKATLQAIMAWLEGTYPKNQSADEDIPWS